MATMNMLHMTPFQVGNITFLSTQNARLAPRLATAGPYAGHSFLPLAVLYDPDQADNRDALLMLDIVTLDITEAFPVDPDDV